MKIILSEREVKSILGAATSITEVVNGNDTQQGQLKTMEYRKQISKVLEEKTGMKNDRFEMNWYKEYLVVEIDEELVSDAVKLSGDLYVNMIDGCKMLYKLFYDKIKNTIHKFNRKWM